MPTPPRPTPRPGGLSPSGGRPMGSAGAGPSMRPGGGSPSGGGRPGMGGGPGNSMLGNRRDTTEKNEKIIYFSQLNFDQTSNDYIMTKVTIGTFVFLLLIGVLAYFLGWGLNAWLGIGIAFLFWGFYFFSSLFMRPRMASMAYKDKKNYWTYEMTDEYKQRNVVLNDFKQKIATELIKTSDKVLIDDVSVELMSYDPLIFDFAIRSGIKKDRIKQEVPHWAGKFDCETGTITSTGINTWRIVYPRRGKWETLSGKKITPKDAVGETKEPSIDCNPIGIRTDNFQEVYIDNATKHTVVSGGTGTGKSNMFNMILMNQFPTDALILFFDGKGEECISGQKRWFSVTEIEQAQAWIGAIKNEMSTNGRRNKAKAAHKAKKFLPADKASTDPDAIPFSPDFPPIIIAIDECHSWCDMKDPVRAGFAREMRAFLTGVAEKGRSHGITLLLAAQQPRDESMPSGAVSQAAQFIAFQQAASFEAYAFGNKGIDITACKPSDIPNVDPDKVGQFAFASEETSNTAIPVKGYFITGDAVEKAAETYSNKKRWNNPVVQDAVRRYKDLYEKSKNKNNLPPTL